MRAVWWWHNRFTFTKLFLLITADSRMSTNGLIANVSVNSICYWLVISLSMEIPFLNVSGALLLHDYVIKWKQFLRYWPFVRGVHRSTMNSPHKSQWRGALMFSLIRACIISWVNNPEAGDSRQYRARYDVIVVGYRLYSKAFKIYEHLESGRIMFVR